MRGEGVDAHPLDGCPHSVLVELYLMLAQVRGQVFERAKTAILDGGESWSGAFSWLGECLAELDASMQVAMERELAGVDDGIKE